MKNVPRLQIDFTRGKMRYRQQHLRGTNELIGKAIGWKCQYHPTVFDTTAGLGSEAFLMAAMGCNVTLFERHPQIAELLQKALANAKQDNSLAHITSKMTLIQACAIEYLTATVIFPPDVVYCDPMFEPRPKSAAVKKEMQFLQQVVGIDQDCVKLATLALQIARKRVVIKRPNYAAPLLENPHVSFKARSHRFDVYCIHSSEKV